MNNVMNAAVTGAKVYDDRTGQWVSFEKNDKVHLPGITCIWLTPKASDRFSSRNEAEKKCLYYDFSHSDEPAHATTVQLQLVESFTDAEYSNLRWSYTLVQISERGWVVQILLGSCGDMKRYDLLGGGSIDDECSE